LIDAVKRLVDEGLDFHLTLAGDGELRGETEELITRLGLQERVTITGWISGIQVREEILKARALVLPSFAEGLPVVLMEAMALGRTVISTYIAGIPELVVNEANGWLVPAGDIDALCGALRVCLASSVDTLRSRGEAGRQRVVDWHDINKEAAKLRALFSQP
jgi:glycosyltransferase involved in cell wall biosynthesis